MKISFVIPAYNAAQYINRSVSSICKINGLDIEVIVVDDGSVDNTCQVVQKLIQQNPEKIKLISQENLGVSVARNHGILEATGDYIAFVDADDEVKSEDFQKVSRILDGGYSCIMFGYDIYGDDNGKYTKYPPLQEGLYGKETLQNLQKNLLDFSYSEMLETNYLGGKVYQYLIKRDILIQNRILFPNELSYAEDLCFVLSLFRLLNQMYVAHISAYIYYVNAGSAMHSYNPKFWENWKKVINYLKLKYKEEYDLTALILSNGIGSIKHFLEHYRFFNSFEIYREIKKVMMDETFRRALNKVCVSDFSKNEYFLIKNTKDCKPVKLMIDCVQSKVQYKIQKDIFKKG